jgi:DNA-binding NarL/FixJ family response regulator
VNQEDDMSEHRAIRRWLTAGLVVGATVVPSAARARFEFNPPESIRASTPAAASRRARRSTAGLTARALEVLALLAEGLRNWQIAERLVVSERTVDHHVSAILRKLSVRTRGEAGAEAVRLGLASLSAG